ncbi:MAG: LacI family DNA-binding transcriptional regulator [Proteobacteria bacterium]|nr:LacI family DNA-binding transcriptional regulator [Pseudomonadota bacterium]
MGKPTVHDIAKEAGVSLATVDRVLNARPGVRGKTVEKVQKAIGSLGYVRDISAANLARQRQYRFAFLLPEGQSQFLQEIRRAIAEAAVSNIADRSEMRVINVSLQDPLSMMRVQQEILEKNIDGVAIMANETPTVRDMIMRIKQAGRIVVTLVTDQPKSERDHFVGVDNVASGRTAGVLMGRFLGQREGKIAVVVNSTNERDMAERRLGFDAVIARDFPLLATLPSLEGRGEQDLPAEITRACLDRHPDVIGLYCAGAGLRSVTKVLEERSMAGRVTVVGHELTPLSREALQRGVVDVIITQNVGHLIRSAARVLRAKCDGVDIVESQEKIRIEIVIRENLI